MALTRPAVFSLVPCKKAGYRTSLEDAEATTLVPPGHRFDQGNMSAIVVDRENRAITMPPGTAIGPGGIGKGLAADLVVSELLALGATGALVNVGGDLAAAGTPPSENGWTIVVEDPFNSESGTTQLEIDGGGVATSSTLTRRWTRIRKAAHHIIDPSTGAPSDTDLAATTVIAPCGWLAEAHATAVILGGSSRFLDYCDGHRLDAVAVTRGRRTLAVDSLASLFRWEPPV